MPSEPLQTTPEQPAPVRQIATLLQQYIDRLGAVWVEGQIAQLNRRQGMSTVFLTLRDPIGDVSLTVTCPRQVVDSADPPVVEGASVVVHGRPRFYPNRGSLSLVVDDIRMVGLGELLARLERRRQLLAAEGLFARERKRRLPFLPQRIGLITGRASAAERDVLMNTRRRWPAVDFRVVNVPVQGPTAVPQIIDALKVLDHDDTIDVIVLARGGGSTEDLLPFSDEALCRAVFGCRTPVVSAIGHETDAPLVDYVADVRASTPTDAAKRLVPDLAEETRLIASARGRLDRAIGNLLERERHRIDSMRSRPVLARPHVLLNQRADEVGRLRERADRVLDHRLRSAAEDLRHTVARLRALSPAATLQRGYAIVQRADGHVVRAATDVAAGDRLRVRLADGELQATVHDEEQPATVHQERE